LAYTIASAIKGLCFSVEQRTARFKKVRLLTVHLGGRMSRFQCKLRLRFCAAKEAIQRIERIWHVFALPTQATAPTRHGLRGDRSFSPSAGCDGRAFARTAPIEGASRCKMWPGPGLGIKAAKRCDSRRFTT